MKRSFDFFIALLGLLVAAPVMLLIMLLIYLKLGSPTLFRQTRPGLYGKPFTVYKFRTMRNTLDAHGQPLPDALRLTKLGDVLRKLSLDELPQLFCVLKDDMSLVGPRPLLMEYLPLYSPRQARRHEVRPGITGWAQVNGRNAISWEEKFDYDVWYVEHQSFSLDMKILFITFARLFRHEGISHDEHVTMPRFAGSGTHEA